MLLSWKNGMQLKEKRVEHVLKTAEMNSVSVEKKEVETRKRMSNEYERLRSNTKNTYDDATDAVKKQNDVYTRELKELNSKWKNIHIFLVRSLLIH